MDEKRLPPEKIDRLAKDVSEKVYRTLSDAYRELRSHEVSKSDTEKVMQQGADKAAERYNSMVDDDK